jgi:diguanylate cyclase (GGDEF)-like protein
MIDRHELMEATLAGFPEGLALLGRDGEVAFWNFAAETITGFPSMDTVCRTVPEALQPLLLVDNLHQAEEAGSRMRSARYVLVQAQHRSGGEVAVMMRSVILRDGLGQRIGTAVVFHSAEGVETSPHGECSENPSLESVQDEMAEQARSAFEDFRERAIPLGLLWISVDQAHELRKSHGARACETMLEKVERTLAHGLKPGEELGRWGEDEFLLLAHETSPNALATHAQALAGLARTSDFRWWGDRPTLTVSIGAAQATHAEALPQLFERAQAAMLASLHAGGNHITLAPERSSCSPS